MLYVLVPVLVHVLLDGSGHDSAEIDGTVERHATSAPTKQPVPAPRHFTTKSSAKADFRLDLGDASRTPHGLQIKKPYERSPESPEKSSPKSKIPVKIRKQIEDEENLKISKTIESDIRTRSKMESHIPLLRSADVVRITKDELLDKDHKILSQLNINRPIDEDKDIIETEYLTKKENIEIYPSKVFDSDKTYTTVTTIVSSSDQTIDPDKLKELMQMDEVLKTVKTVTTTMEITDSGYPTEVVKRETTRITEVSPDLRQISEDQTNIGLNTSNSSSQSMKTNEDGTFIERVTTIRHFTGPFYSEKLSQSMLESMRTGDDRSDDPFFSSDMKTSECEIDRGYVKAGKSESDERDTWAQAAAAEYSINNSEQWETQLSLDTSPGSGNGDIYTKNDSSRHELNSDTDSDGSPRPRRRSPCKRRTLGSSSGSDVALHEGAELSPLEDDQGTALTANLLSKQCTNPANQLPRIRNCVRT